MEHTFRSLRSKRGGVEDRMETRNLTRASAIKFNCLLCAGGSPSEVGLCHLEYCPLWPFRPFQKKENENGNRNCNNQEEIDPELIETDTNNEDEHGTPG